MPWVVHALPVSDNYKIITVDYVRTSFMFSITEALFLSQERVSELSRLAQEVVRVDKYRSETCSVLGT